MGAIFTSLTVENKLNRCVGEDHFKRICLNHVSIIAFFFMHFLWFCKPISLPKCLFLKCSFMPRSGTGESGEWEKKMLFENTARVPLIIHNPRSPVHRRTTVIAELIDVYPTAVELAGFIVPPGLDGVSLAPLVGSDVRSSVDFDPMQTINKAAFTQYPRCHDQDQLTGTCLQVPNTQFRYMGYSVRTTTFRYTEWRTWNGTALRAKWDTPPVAAELYNHTDDTADGVRPFDWPQINLINNGTLHAVIAELHAMLVAQFRPI